MYEAEQDPACYEGTTVLINSAGIRNQPDLDEFEFAMFLTRADEPLPGGQLDVAHYCAIHRHLFQDVYGWAGEFRTVRIAKGGNWFCYPEHIDREMTGLFASLDDDDFLATGPSRFPDRAARFLAELNAIHPFREGNGRTQLVFLQLLAANAALPFDDTALDPVHTLDAMIASFAGNLEQLTALIRKIVSG